MTDGYFERMTRQTASRLWINNPTLAEAHRSIAAGAISCTTNPTYCANMLRRDGEFAKAVIAGATRHEADDLKAARLAQQQMVQRIMAAFGPVYVDSGGKAGFVSVQGDPRRDEDAGHIVEECLDDHRRLPANHIAKVPVTAAGLAAIERLIAEDVPVIATEVFGLAQAVRVCELYQQASERTGKTPPFFVTHITGIFDEYLGELVAREGIRMAPEVLAQAGSLVGKRQYQLLKERGYPGTMLGGGARSTRHFTEFVGGDMHVTINWSTAEEILAADPPLESRIGDQADPAVVRELYEKLPDFRKAWDLEGMAVEEFAGFGPVQHFRNKFIQGWETLLGEIRKRR